LHHVPKEIPDTQTNGHTFRLLPLNGAPGFLAAVLFAHMQAIQKMPTYRITIMNITKLVMAHVTQGYAVNITPLSEILFLFVEQC